MSEQITVGLFLIFLGCLEIFVPEAFVRFQVWSQRVFMGAKLEPSDRTYSTVPVVGALIFLLGILVFTGVIQ